MIVDSSTLQQYYQSIYQLPGRVKEFDKLQTMELIHYGLRYYTVKNLIEKLPYLKESNQPDQELELMPAKIIRQVLLILFKHQNDNFVKFKLPEDVLMSKHYLQTQIMLVLDKEEPEVIISALQNELQKVENDKNTLHEKVIDKLKQLIDYFENEYLGIKFAKLKVRNDKVKAELYYELHKNTSPEKHITLTKILNGENCPGEQIIYNGSIKTLCGLFKRQIELHENIFSLNKTELMQWLTRYFRNKQNETLSQNTVKDALKPNTP